MGTSEGATAPVDDGLWSRYVVITLARPFVVLFTRSQPSNSSTLMTLCTGTSLNSGRASSTPPSQNFRTTKTAGPVSWAGNPSCWSRQQSKVA
jgi:hypothetical protein